MGVKAGVRSRGSICSRHFSCEFSHKMALACPCAFRLRGLAQTVHPNLGPRHFSCKFSHQMAHEAALVTRPCAFRLRRLAQTLRCNLGPQHFPCKFSHEISLVIWACGFRLRRLPLLVPSITILQEFHGALLEALFTYEDLD